MFSHVSEHATDTMCFLNQIQCAFCLTSAFDSDCHLDCCQKAAGKCELLEKLKQCFLT